MRSAALRVNQFLLFWILLVIVLIYGKPVLFPITFAAFLSMLMSPFIDFLDNRGLEERLPIMQQRANDLLLRLHNYIEINFDYSVNLQQVYLKEWVNEGVK